MNREIKFRVWDDQFKKMITTDADDIRMNIANGNLHGKLSGGNVKEWIPLQYTGLKDRNGVEIYEGDVVLMNQHLYFLPPATRTKPLVVGFKDCGFSATRKRPLEHMLLDYRRDIEVIGNIYENPELLEGEK